MTRILGSLLLSLTFVIGAEAKSTANVEGGVGLKGYDPVSYFDSAKPAKGSPQFKSDYEGATYLFATADHKSQFEKNPKKFAPAYEGWCATAVAKNKKVDIDPLNYKVTDGRLFLFYHEEGLFGGDAKPQWVKDEPAYIKKADANWPQVRTMEP